MYITTKVKICHIFLHSLTLTEFYAYDPISFFKTKIVNIVYVYLKIVYSSKMSQRVIFNEVIHWHLYDLTIHCFLPKEPTRQSKAIFSTLNSGRELISNNCKYWINVT